MKTPLRLLSFIAATFLAYFAAPVASALYDPATYSATDPTFPVTYTPAQIAAQRTAGASMMSALVAAAGSGASEYTIAPGVYRVTGGLHALNNRANFTIRCAGVEIWLEYDSTVQSLQWLALNNCTNIKILGPVTFDSEMLQFVQCTITGWNAAAGTIDVRVNAGYDTAFTHVMTPPPGFNNGMFHYDTAGVNRSRPYLSGYTDYDATDVAKKRLSVGTFYFLTGEGSALQVGHLMLLRNNIPGTRNPVFVNTNCTDIELRDIASYHGPMWAWGWSRGKFINVNCSNYRRPGSNRLGGSEEPPNFDYVNEFVYDGCNSGPGQDDGVNTLRTIAWVCAQTAPRVIVTHVQPAVGETFVFNHGDTWAPQGSAIVAAAPAAVTDGAARAAYIAAFNDFQAAQGYAWRLGASQPLWFVTFDRDLAVTANAMINRTGNRMASFTARNCYFADMNVGCFISKGADSVLIENNVMDRGRWESVVVGPSRYWWEGPASKNIIIRDNQINQPANKYGAALAFAGKSSIINVGVDGDSSAKVIENVSITGNTIVGATVNPIRVANAINVTVSNNTFVAPEPEATTYSLHGEEAHCGVFVAACSGAVVINANSLVSPTAHTTTLIQFGPHMQPSSLSGSDIPANAPTALRVTPVSASLFTLAWTDNAFDESGYVVERKTNGNGAYVRLALLPANSTTYSDTTAHVADGTYYSYRVRAAKGALLSAFSNTVRARLPFAGTGGLDFDYHEKMPRNLAAMPDYATLAPTLSGVSANVGIAMSETPEFYGLEFRGRITIPVSGTYTFYTTSDDIASLSINGATVVSAGAMGSFGIERSGGVTLAAGVYPFRLSYLQSYGGASLSLQWSGPGIAKTAVPDSAFSRATPAAPGTLVATAGGPALVNLSWSDLSDCEDGYVVERRLGTAGAWTQVGSVGVGETTFTDLGVSPGTGYQYRVRAFNNTAASAYNTNGNIAVSTPAIATVAWFKADAITGLAGGSALSSWSDSSGLGNHATQSVAAWRPSYATDAINGLPAVRFDAAAFTHLPFARVVQDDFTIFAVYQSTQGVGSGIAYFQGAGLVNGEVPGVQADFGASLNADGRICVGAGAPDTFAYSGMGFNDGRPHLLAFRRVRSTGAVQLHVDGVLVSSATAGTQSLVAPPRLVLGGQQTGAPYLTGDIAEVKIFNGALDDTTRQAEETALRNKYAIGLPAPWLSRDVGAVGLAGGALHAGGVFTLKGAGADIFGPADAFRFVHQSATGDAELVARVDSVTSPDGWAKGAVMIRESLDPAARMAYAGMRPDNQVFFAWRSSTGSGGAYVGPLGGTTGPKWLRIVRAGNVFTAYYKVLASDPWTQIGSAQTIPMAAATRIGIGMCSHNTAIMGTGVFSNVTATP